ncbi:MAG: orotidine-5'-phosphate decarboxylase [Desulfobacterales bacterium]
MKRAKEYIIFPLDVPTFQTARHYVKLLSPHVGMFKVGLELFIHCGPDIVKMITMEGDAGIFLDLKLHDIPATVERAMARTAELGVAFATVHCGESTEMLKAAVAGSRERLKVLGVTVLTSVSGKDLALAGYNDAFADDPTRLVLKRAAAAKEAGCAGVVCSGRETAAIKTALGRDFLAVTPGIRLEADSVSMDDQKRVATPADAVRSGSDYLVIGRPIRDAADPVAAVRHITEAIDEGLAR